MSKIKVFCITGIAFTILTGATALAFFSPAFTGTPAIASGSAGVDICPCRLPFFYDLTEDGDIYSGNDLIYDDIGTGGGGADGGTDRDDGNESNDNCDHSDKCNKCDDCIVCGKDPCADCCDENRRCGDICDTCGDCLNCGDNPHKCHDCCRDGRRCYDCILCTFDIGMNDGSLQYTGTGLLSFKGGTINKGSTAEGAWIYEYTPVPGTGAALDGSGLPLRVGKYYVTGIYDNGRYKDRKTSILTVTPAPLSVSVTLAAGSKVYDGTTNISIKTASLDGILAGDDVKISAMGSASYSSPNAGVNIPLIFSEFKLGGTHAWNYYVVPPSGYTANITRAVYKGSISVKINDDPLRIGSVLSFTASSDPSGYLVQWRVDGKDIKGANSVSYIVSPEDADKRISVALISPCGNYEGESPSTTYVPYTIKIDVSTSAKPMSNDYVYFGEFGNYTAYAASKNNGYVEVDYILHNSGFGTDNIEYTGGKISAVNDAGSGKSKYYANPADAVNGIIKLHAVFYHRGITVSPGGTYIFAPVMCGKASNETHKITISQSGNAPTGSVRISKGGAFPGEYSISSTYIPGLGIGEKYELEIRVDNSLSPTDLDGVSYAASIIIDGKNVAERIIPVSIRVDHDFPPFTYKGGYHEHACTGCGFHKSGNCTYGAWNNHARICSVCSGTSTHTPEWSSWSQGTATQHTRTCTICSLVNNANHTWGNWTTAGTTQHTRTCSTCSRQDNQNHTWGAWSAWGQGTATQHSRTRSCTTAGCTQIQTENANHSWVNFTGGNSAANHRCSDCSREAAHTWSGWSSINSTQHRRTCSGCSRSETGNCDILGAVTQYNADPSVAYGVGWGWWGGSLRHRYHCSVCSAITGDVRCFNGIGTLLSDTNAETPAPTNVPGLNLIGGVWGVQDVPIHPAWCVQRCREPRCATGRNSNDRRYSSPYPCSWNNDSANPALNHLSAANKTAWFNQTGTQNTRFYVPGDVICRFCGNPK